MDKNSLIKYIFRNGDKDFTSIVENWLISSNRFYNFVLYNKDKIRKKIKNCNNKKNEMSDLIFEMEVAYLLLRNELFTVTYEKEFKKYNKKPDFLVQYKNETEFIIEVKRIIGAQHDDLVKEFDEKIKNQISHLKSSLAFSFWIDCTVKNDSIFTKLHNEIPNIVKFIKKKVDNFDQKLSSDDIKEFVVPGFDNNFFMEVTSPTRKANNSFICYYGLTSRPVFYSQKEYYKFTDDIFDKIRQLIPNKTNLLIITSASETHEDFDLSKTIHCIFTNIIRNNKDFFITKGFKDIEDFNSYFKNLSGILYLKKTSEQDVFWINDCSNLKCRISLEVIKYLENMRFIRSSSAGPDHGPAN